MSRKWRGVNRETPRNKDAKAQDHEQGDGKRRGCSSPRVLGWLVVTMNLHSVEISIAGGVEEMVLEPNPKPFVLFFSFFILGMFGLLGTKSACSVKL